ncbi:MAG: type II toxin-antitoxin system RelE/ParE family toxin [Candidatus Woesearchaeota archaeon]
MYTVILSSDAEKHLRKFPKEIQQRIAYALERIRIRPHQFVERLTNSPYYKYRVGDYRIILAIVDDKLVILIVDINHRKNVYKKLGER